MKKSKRKLTTNKFQKLNSSQQSSLIPQKEENKNMTTIKRLKFDSQTEIEMYWANQWDQYICEYSSNDSNSIKEDSPATAKRKDRKKYSRNKNNTFKSIQLLIHLFECYVYL